MTEPRAVAWSSSAEAISAWKSRPPRASWVLDVTVLEMADRIMARVTCPEVSSFYEAEHARHGVRIYTQASVQALVGDPASGRVKSVLTEDGAEHPADLVIVGVGVLAADELAVRGRYRVRERHRRGPVLSHVRCGDLCRRRLHQSSKSALRPARPARVG